VRPQRVHLTGLTGARAAPFQHAPSMTEEFRFDVWSASEGVRREQRVLPGEDSLRVGDLEVGYGEILWKARRADLLMLFTERRTLALQGRSDPLNRLHRLLVRRLSSGEKASRSRYLRAVAEEVVLFAAAVAARGRLDGHPVTGLHVAVVTREALHLFSGASHRSVPFPAEQCRVRTGSDREGTRDTVLLRRGEDLLELLYLFPEEREALLEAAL